METLPDNLYQRGYEFPWEKPVPNCRLLGRLFICFKDHIKQHNFIFMFEFNSKFEVVSLVLL